jgi:hypothetical protein
MLLYFTVALVYKFSSTISPTMAMASISTLAPLGNAPACKKKSQFIFIFVSVKRSTGWEKEDCNFLPGRFHPVFNQIK